MGPIETMTINTLNIRNRPWIDPTQFQWAGEEQKAEEEYAHRLIDQQVYVVETTHLRGYDNDPHWYTLHTEPQRTNMEPHKVLAHGWLGTTDNRSRFAHGLYRVISNDGTRITLELVSPENEG